MIQIGREARKAEHKESKEAGGSKGKIPRLGRTPANIKDDRMRGVVRGIKTPEESRDGATYLKCPPRFCEWQTL